MKPKVYFVKLEDNCSDEEQAAATAGVFDAAGAKKCIGQGDLVAVKVHVGEKNQITYLNPANARAVVQKVRACGGEPFLTETSTLYLGERGNAVRHLAHAFSHGFGFDAVGAPFVMSDGLAGNSEIEVEIPGELNRFVKIAREIRIADAVVAVSHATGHLATGLGAAIKNLGMGLSSRAGKMRQHSSVKPQISAEKCQKCRKCAQWCPEGVIVEENGDLRIDLEKCIGCGQCLAVCRFSAVEYNWGQDSKTLQKQIAEHAYGVVIGRREKFFFINVLVNMTRDCDCMAKKQSKIMPDVGILGSFDPVAIDKATLDLTAEAYGKDLAAAAYGHLNAQIQLDHAEKIGLGVQQYELVEV